MSVGLSVATVLPPTWSEVLDRVQLALGQAEAAAALRARDLDGDQAADPEQSRREMAWLQSLERLRERLGGLETCARHAEEQAAVTETALDEVAAEVDRWRKAAEAVTQKLADGAAGSVK